MTYASWLSTVRPRLTGAPTGYFAARAAWETSLAAPAPVAREGTSERALWRLAFGLALSAVVLVEVLSAVL